MIKFEFNENIQNHNHGDSIIEFPTINKKLIGDTYWFRVGLEPSISYKEMVEYIASTYKNDFKAIKILPITHSYFWFFHFFDQSDYGVLITNLENENFKLNFVIKCKDHREQYIFEVEEYFLEKELFLVEMEKELDKFLV